MQEQDIKTKIKNEIEKYTFKDAETGRRPPTARERRDATMRRALSRRFSKLQVEAFERAIEATLPKAYDFQVLGILDKLSRLALKELKV